MHAWWLLLLRWRTPNLGLGPFGERVQPVDGGETGRKLIMTDWLEVTGVYEYAAFEGMVV